MTKFKSKTWDPSLAILPRFAQIKRDGHLLHVIKDNYGRVTLFTRKPTDVTESLKFLPCLYTPAVTLMPKNSWCAGELWYPGMPASYVKTAIKDRDTLLRFEVFWVGENHVTPDAGLVDVQDWATRYGFYTPPFWVRSGDTSPRGSSGRFSDPVKLYDENFKEDPDVEGLMLKHSNGSTQGREWYKYKPIKTIDLVVSGFTEGDGKYAGQVGSLVLKSAEGYHVANASGMDDETRWDITLNEDSWRGAVCEIRYQYVGAKGRLRHPAFLRRRYDKQPDECTVDQDVMLATYWRNKETQIEGEF